MASASENKQQTDLLGQLRRFSADHVKIPVHDQEWARRLVNDVLTENVFVLCTELSELPIRKFEYTGSTYEHLTTEGADVDVMVVLTTDEVVTEPVNDVPGYVRLKVTDGSSRFSNYTNRHGYLLPKKFRSAWFTSLFTRVVTEIESREPSLAGKLKIRSHGPAIQLDITDKSPDKVLSCDLVPSFQMGDNFYVAKPCPQEAGNQKTLWRQSFSVREKSVLLHMDKDHGCRHELFRIVKTIIRSEVTFSKLTTYHLKTAFLRYNSESPRDWHQDRLADRFREYLGEILQALARKNLPHCWVQGVNLFDGIKPTTLKNMKNRIRRLLNNSNSLTKILQPQASPTRGKRGRKAK